MMLSIKSHFILDFLFLLSFTSSLTTAHNAGGATGASDCTASEIPSVFLNDHDGSLAQGNIGLGFGLTAIAAAACAIGSMAPFIDTLLARFPYFDGFRITESKGFLAAALALASGVLLFLTLGDLFPEAVSSFGESGWFDKKWSRMVATAIFIGTATSIMLFKSIVRKLTPKKTLVSPCLCDPTALECKCHIFETGKTPVLGLCGCEVNEPAALEDDNPEQREHARMKRLGIQVAIALAIHNFPEGLSTFAATIISPRIGIVYAIALSLHKFPEGLIISVPIYCATGSRWMAFLIATTAGVVSQMLGAVLGYVLLVTYYNQAISGILFSIVTACLIYVIVHNMLPMARRYDPEDRYVTTFTFLGLFFFGIVAAIFDLA